jgi:hypothetical protein
VLDTDDVNVASNGDKTPCIGGSALKPDASVPEKPKHLNMQAMLEAQSLGGIFSQGVESGQQSE